MEILSVVFVVSLVLAIAVVRFDRNDGAQVQLEASRFASLANQLREEAILRGVPMGISVDPVLNSYTFLRYAGNWRVMQDDSIFRFRELPESMSLRLELPGEVEREDEQEDDVPVTTVPDIITEPFGIINSFRLEFKGEDSTAVVTLDGSSEVVIESDASDG